MRLLSLVFLLLTLAACGTETVPPEVNSAATANETRETSETEASLATPDHTKPQQGGEVVETGKYHLEFVAIPEEKGLHIDFYLQDSANHQAIADAQVTAQIQAPNGETQEIPLQYDAPGEHYYGIVTGLTKGEHQVVVLSDIGGEKVNGRFSFSY